MFKHFNYEVYLFLGSLDNVHFFFHMIFSNNFESNISHQIYNILIDNQFIDNNNEIVIIYEFNISKKEVNVISIQHINNEKYLEFDKNNLENIYPKLIDHDSHKNKKSFVIKYYYNNKSYSSIYIDNFPQLFDGDDDNINKKININTIHEVITKKNITN
jgi:hypothetical protein